MGKGYAEWRLPAHKDTILRCDLHAIYQVKGSSVTVIEVLFLLWRLQPSLRLCVNTYVVLTVMPCIVLRQPHLLGLSVALTITALDKRRRYCQLPVSGRRMQRFLQFRLGSHNLPIVAGGFSGDQHVARTDRVCTHCGGTVVADELHMIHECPVLQPLRLQYAALFTPDTDTMMSFFAQQDHVQVSNLSWIVLIS